MPRKIKNSQFPFDWFISVARCFNPDFGFFDRWGSVRGSILKKKMGVGLNLGFASSWQKSQGSVVQFGSQV